MFFIIIILKFNICGSLKRTLYFKEVLAEFPHADKSPRHGIKIEILIFLEIGLRF